jgi:transposase
MRQVTKYTEAIKNTVLSKALGPNAPGVPYLSKEFNIPPSTIHTWLYKMGKNESFKSHKINQRPKDISLIDKFQAVLDTLGKTDEEKGAYCRMKGIHSNHLEEWKEQMLEGLGKTSLSSTGMNKANRSADKQIKDEIKQLKRDLHRKEKALAEVTALLVLKKKADLLWGENEDD